MHSTPSPFSPPKGSLPDPAGSFGWKAKEKKKSGVFLNPFPSPGKSGVTAAGGWAAGGLKGEGSGGVGSLLFQSVLKGGVVTKWLKLLQRRARKEFPFSRGADLRLSQCMKVKSESEVAQSCQTLSDPRDGISRLLCPWDFLGKSTGVGNLSLLQGIFPTQGSNLGLPCCRQILYQLSHNGSLKSLVAQQYRICL